MRSLAILIMACSLVSCATNDPGNAEQMTSPDKTADAKCPVISSDGWRAWINIMPSPDKERNLHIIGMLELPTPGYDVRLIAGAADRAMPPSQQFQLVLTPPEGIVTQVVSSTKVDYQGPATYSDYRSIQILCGGKNIATIRKVNKVS